MSRRWCNGCRAVLVAALLALGGCIGKAQNPAATQPATAVDPATTQPEYWLAQPGVASVQSAEFQKLWDACQNAAKDRFFVIDRTDYRLGLLTTRASTSQQFFEPWRRDAVTPHERAESSLATIRRTVQFRFTRNEDGTYTAVPKVVVEREAVVGRRITAVVQARSAFAPAPGQERRLGADGKLIPSRYWYAIGRDEALEKTLAKSVQDKL